MSRLWFAVVLSCLLIPEGYAAAPPARRLDRYGDHLPIGAVARLGSNQWRHPMPFIGGGLAFSPDGSKVASLSDRLRLWDRATGRLLFEADTLECWDKSLAFSPDGGKIVTGHRSQVWVWDLATGQRKRLWKRSDYKGWPQHIAFSPDGRTLAIHSWSTTSARDDHIVYLYSFPSLQERANIPGYGPLAFTPNSQQLLIGAPGLQIWDLATLKLIQTIKVPSLGSALAVSLDGKTVAVHGNGTVTLISLGSSPTITPTKATGPGPSALVIGKDVLFSALDERLLAIDRTTGSARTIVPPPDVKGRQVKFQQFSLDGKWLVQSDRMTMRVRETASGKMVTPTFEDHRDGSPIDLDVSPDGKLIASISSTELRIWELETGKMLRRIPGKDLAPGVRWSPDGKSVSVGWPGKFAWYSAETGKLLREVPLPLPAGELSSASLLKDGKRVLCKVALDVGRLLIVLDLATGKELWRGDDKSGEVLVELSEDGQRALWKKYRDSQVQFQVREFPAGRVLWEHTLADVHSEHGFFAGRYVALSGDDGVGVWDVERGLIGVSAQRRRTFHGKSVAISRDGRVVVLNAEQMFEQTADDANEMRTKPFSDVWIVEAVSGQTRHEFPLQTLVSSATFSPDGRRLVTGTMEGSGLVWDVYHLAGRSSLTHAWEDLASPNGRIAFAAVCSLVTNPDDGVSLLKKTLLPANLDTAKIQTWFKDLGAESFDRRTEAERQLVALGEDIEADVRKALEANPPLEDRMRLRRLLSPIEKRGPESFRRTRALEALERIGSAEAKALVRKLAEGYPGSRLTRQATETMARLK